MRTVRAIIEAFKTSPSEGILLMTEEAEALARSHENQVAVLYDLVQWCQGKPVDILDVVKMSRWCMDVIEGRQLDTGFGPRRPVAFEKDSPIDVAQRCLSQAGPFFLFTENALTVAAFHMGMERVLQQVLKWERSPSTDLFEVAKQAMKMLSMVTGKVTDGDYCMGLAE